MTETPITPELVKAIKPGDVLRDPDGYFWQVDTVDANGRISATRVLVIEAPDEWAIITN